MRGMEQLQTFLFSEDRKVVNIKFWPGSNRDLTPDQLAAAANELLATVDAANKNEPPVSGLAPADAELAFA